MTKVARSLHGSCAALIRRTTTATPDLEADCEF